MTKTLDHIRKRGETFLLISKENMRKGKKRRKKEANKIMDESESESEQGQELKEKRSFCTISALFHLEICYATRERDCLISGLWGENMMSDE